MANTLNIIALIGSVIAIIAVIFWREISLIMWNIVAALLWWQVICLRKDAEKAIEEGDKGHE